MELSASEIIVAILGAGGGSAVVAFAIFRFLGTSWMDNLFAQRLESFRHENAKELESLKASIDGSLNATIRYQEKEFEALSECWKLANTAFGRTQDYASAFQSYQDISAMSQDMREEYVRNLDLMEAQKDEILNALEPQKEFMSVVSWQKRNTAANAQGEFRNFLFRSEIFMREDMAKKFKEILGLMSDALLKKELSKEGSDLKMSIEASRLMRDETHSKLEALAPKLRSKFFERV